MMMMDTRCDSAPAPRMGCGASALATLVRRRESFRRGPPCCALAGRVPVCSLTRRRCSRCVLRFRSSCLVAAMLCLLSMAYAVQPEVDGHVVEVRGNRRRAPRRSRVRSHACSQLARTAQSLPTQTRVRAQPNSSVKFPVTVPGEKGSLYLTGTAIRVKKIVFVSVQVYAVGLYTDKKVGRRLVACFVICGTPGSCGVME